MAISRLQTCCLGAVAMCLVAPGRLSAQMPDVRPCSIGYVEGNNNEKEDIVVGHNFWVTIRTDKSPVEANLTAGTWLRCAEEDLEAGEFDSARVRLDEIVSDLPTHGGDPLIVASAKFRIAAIMLRTRTTWPDALVAAEQAEQAFDQEFPSASSNSQRAWLNWPGYNAQVYERVFALHVLARAYRANRNPLWEPTIDKSIAIAKTGAGEDSSLYRACVGLKRQLSGRP